MVATIGRHSRESGNPSCFETRIKQEVKMDPRFRGDDGFLGSDVRRSREQGTDHSLERPIEMFQHRVIEDRRTGDVGIALPLRDEAAQAVALARLRLRAQADAEKLRPW